MNAAAWLRTRTRALIVIFMVRVDTIVSRHWLTTPVRQDRLTQMWKLRSYQLLGDEMCDVRIRKIDGERIDRFAVNEVLGWV